MNIDGMTLVIFFLSPRLVAGPRKPQKLTTSKIKYEHFGPNILVPHWKMNILVPLYFKKLNFLNTSGAILKLYDPQKFQFPKNILPQKLLLS